MRVFVHGLDHQVMDQQLRFHVAVMHNQALNRVVDDQHHWQGQNTDKLKHDDLRCRRDVMGRRNECRNHTVVSFFPHSPNLTRTRRSTAGRQAPMKQPARKQGPEQPSPTVPETAETRRTITKGRPGNRPHQIWGSTGAPARLVRDGPCRRVTHSNTGTRSGTCVIVHTRPIDGSANGWQCMLRDIRSWAG